MVVFILSDSLFHELAEHVEWIAHAWTIGKGGSRGNGAAGGTISVVFGLAVLVLTGYIYSYFWGKLKLIRSFKAIAQSSIAKCSDGEIVRIQGTLELMPTKLTAPFSQRQCSAYSISALKPAKTNDWPRTYWDPIAFKLLANDFLIRLQNVTQIYPLRRFELTSRFINKLPVDSNCIYLQNTESSITLTAMHH